MSSWPVEVYLWREEEGLCVRLLCWGLAACVRLLLGLGCLAACVRLLGLGLGCLAAAEAGAWLVGCCWAWLLGRGGHTYQP